MKLLGLSRLFWLMVVLFCGQPLALADGEKTLRLAEQYFRADNRPKFNQQAALLKKNQDYLPLVSYWSAVLSLRQNRLKAAKTFIAMTESDYLREKLRQQLLVFYINHDNPTDFSTYANEGSDCARTLNGFFNGKADQSAVRALWIDDTKMNDAVCMYLYRLAQQQDILNDDDVWSKIRALAGKRKLSACRRLLSAFPGYVKYKTVRRVVKQASRHIGSKHGLGQRSERELLMIAAMVTTRSNPEKALKRWQQFSRYFSATENNHVWTVLAEWAARWRRDDALIWYRRSDGSHTDDNSRAWRVRAALRASDYPEVLETILSMPAQQQQVSAWRYWHGFALQQQGHQQDAEAIWKTLASETDDYYGLLARETLGIPLVGKQSPPPAPITITGDFALALSLYQAGLDSLALRIWRHASRNQAIPDTQRLAAAQQAQRLGWYLASIDAANKAKTASAYHLRFPLPYRQEIGQHSHRFLLDEAFVYGLIRQESRFMPKIVSAAKARGLMQVIPSTARQVARQHGFTRYRLSRLTRVDTNLTIGNAYLSDLSRRFDANAAAVAAAYNAGPSRVPAWFDDAPSLLVTIENIPITETRLYVKHLMANRLHYAARLGQDSHSLLALMQQPISAN